MIEIRYAGDRPLQTRRWILVRNDAVSPHRPDREAPIIPVFPKDVAEASSVEISNSGNPPIQPDRRDFIIGKNTRAAHIPDANFASLRVSPEDILLAIRIKIARRTEEIRDDRACGGRSRRGCYESLDERSDAWHTEPRTQIVTRARVINPVETIA